MVTDDSRVGAAPPHERTILTVVGNLVTNAIEAVADQQGTREIVVRIQDADGVRIEVSDTGPGIPGLLRDDVFVDGYTTKSAPPGARRGLGLAIVSRLVFRAGGTITVTGEGGARFVVYLPVSTPALAAPELVERFG